MRINRNSNTMATYNMTCTCGHVISTDASTRDEAVSALKAMMNEEAIAKHIKEKHPGGPTPSVNEVHMMIEKNTVAA